MEIVENTLIKKEKETNMKVIFLDFNGVLDTWENMNIVNQDNLMRLKKIVEETQAQIVISSSVKTSFFFTDQFNEVYKYLLFSLQEAALEVLGITPLARGKEQEIKAYLDSHPEVENFCILDDDYEMPSFKEHIVKIPLQSKEYPNGLTDEHVDEAIAILNKTKEKNILYKKYLKKKINKEMTKWQLTHTCTLIV